MSLADNEPVKIVVQGSVTEVVINRPKALNALNPDLLVTLINCFEKLARDESIRVVLIYGAGEKAFVAGADITSMADLGPKPIADYVELGQRAMRVLENFPVPVIALVNGYALGGGLELALACDLIFAGRSALLGQPEVKLGIIPGFGGTQRLIQRCGIGSARWLCYSGELLDAEQALQKGVVDQIFADDSLLEEGRKFAQVVASRAPLAVRAVKRVIRESQEAVLLSGLRMEVEQFLATFGSADREEGMRAFMQRRDPKFIGR